MSMRAAAQEIRLYWRCFQKAREEMRQLYLSNKESKAFLASLDRDPRRAEIRYLLIENRIFASFALDGRKDAKDLAEQVICRAARKIASGQIPDPVKYLATVGKEVLQEKPLAPTYVNRLTAPPGWRLRSFADSCFSKKTFTQVLEPALSDMQKEHFEALAAGRPWKARMVLVRGYWSFWSAVVAQLPISLARRVYEIWKATKIGS